jgi:hypothetical protein
VFTKFHFQLCKKQSGFFGTDIATIADSRWTKKYSARYYRKAGRGEKGVLDG